MPEKTPVLGPKEKNLGVLDLDRLVAFQRQFVKERDWEPFHSPKNLVMALAGEAGELVEIFQWLNQEDAEKITDQPDKKTAIEDELADILYYTIRIADKLNIQIGDAFWNKMRKNELKYPAHLARGSAKKYTELSSR